MKAKNAALALSFATTTALGGVGGLALQRERVKDAHADRALYQANARQFEEQRTRAERNLRIAAEMSRSQDETYRDCLDEKRKIRRVAVDAYRELYGSDGDELVKKAIQGPIRPARQR